MDKRADYSQTVDKKASDGQRALPPASSITVDDEGRYFWRGTIDLHENPTLLLLITKIMAWIMGLIALMLVCFVVIDWLKTGRVDRDGVWMLVGVYAMCSVVVAFITAIAYYAYCSHLGWSYSADYLMDETGLLFEAAPKEAEALKDVAKATALMSLLIGRYGLTAASIAASSSEAASRFASVFRVKGIKKHCCIKVSSPFLYNQVYVSPRDYDFVYNYICEHCPKATCVEA